MNGPNNKNPFSLWDKIKETDTFKKMKSDVNMISEGFKNSPEDKTTEMSTDEMSKDLADKPNEHTDSFELDRETDESIESTKHDEEKTVQDEDNPTKELDQSEEEFSEETKSEHFVEEEIAPVVLPAETEETGSFSPEPETTDAESHTRSSRKEQSSAGAGWKRVGKKFLYVFDIGYGVAKSLLIFFIVLLVLGAAFAGGTGAGFFASLVYGHDIPPYEVMENEVTSVTSTSTIYYGTGEVLSDLRTDLKRTPIRIEEMSENVLNAIIATEDEYFLEHEGIVPKAILRALFQEFSGSSMTSGGSTLTQQLIKQQMLTNETSFERKANEIMLAMRLEDTMEKDEILEAYMNVSPFGRNNKGENIAGIQEASKGIFGLEASELNIPQAAFLAGLPQSPIAYSPYNQYGELREDYSAGLNRQQNVLFFMYREGYLTETEYEEATNYDVTQDFISSENTERTDRSFLYDSIEREAASILMDLALAEDGLTRADLSENDELRAQYEEEADLALRMGGYNIHTTVHRNIHETMEQVAHERRNELGSPRDVYQTNSETGEEMHWVENVENGSVLLDNQSGRILGFVGGVDYENNQNNHALYRRRPPASTIKPLIVFGPALELGLITPASMIMDSEVTVRDGNGTHTPTNAGRTTNQFMTARHALSISQNIPATKIYLDMYEDHDLKPFIRNAGIGPQAIPDSDFSNASLAIGGTTYGTTVLEMTSAFSSIANNGVRVEPFLIERIESKTGEMVFEHEQATTEVFSPETSFLLQDMLRDTLDTGTAAGTEDWLSFSGDFIGKTGTSNDTEDVWFLASTPQVTLGSWMGYDTPAEMWTEFGHYPARRNRIFWSHLMNAIYQVNPVVVGTELSFQTPEGIEEDSVLAATGMKSGRVEMPNGSSVFISGNTVTEYFDSDNIPGTTTYDFPVYPIEGELQAFWRRFARPSSNQEDRSNGNEDENTEEDSEETEEDSQESDANETESEEGTEESAPEDESEEAPANEGNEEETEEQLPEDE